MKDDLSQEDIDLASIELEEELRWQTVAFYVRRVAWFGALLVLLATVFGLLGNGWAANTQVGTEADALWMQYERFLRLQVASTLEIYVAPTAVAASNNTIEISFSRAYFDDVKMETVVPTPEEVTHDAAAITYTFEVNDNGRRPTRVNFYFTPQRFGLIEGTVGLRAGEMRGFWHLVYP